MSRYLIPKDDFVKIVTDKDLQDYVPSMKRSITEARNVLYNELPKHKNCCHRDWNALRSYVVILAQQLKADPEAKARFKQYMTAKYNVPETDSLLFFFREGEHVIYDLF